MVSIPVQPFSAFESRVPCTRLRQYGDYGLPRVDRTIQGSLFVQFGMTRPNLVSVDSGLVSPGDRFCTGRALLPRQSSPFSDCVRVTDMRLVGT
jgi:hypothetical protein